MHEQQFNNGRLKAAWNRDEYKEANLSILKKKQQIDRLITEAYQNNLDEVTYVEAYLDTKNDDLKQLSTTKSTLLVDAFDDYVNNYKVKSKKISEARSLERCYAELNRLKIYDPKAKLGDIDIKWIETFTEFLMLTKTFTKLTLMYFWCIITPYDNSNLE